MHEVTPAINCHWNDTDCVREKIEQIKTTSATWVHLDVADAHFTFNKSWSDPRAWKQLGADFSLEVHLMVEYPERVVEEWLQAGARRVIIHAESIMISGASRLVDDEDVVSVVSQLCDAYGAQLMLSLNPETLWDTVKPFTHYLREFQVLAVIPGLSGQKFLPTVLEKISQIRADRPTALIEVDGGVNEHTAPTALAAGADILVSSSFLLDNKKYQASVAYDMLKNAAPRAGITSVAAYLRTHPDSSPVKKKKSSPSPAKKAKTKTAKTPVSKKISPARKKTAKK